jgi:hypothetical protein
MAARNAHKIPGELGRAAARWAKWRRTRALGTRIPDSLWQLAVESAAQYGVSTTATTLGVDYYALKKRLNAQTSPRRVGLAAAPAFVELAPSSLAAARGCVIELEKASGAKMRIELPGDQVPALVALSQSFWEAR